MDWLAGKSLEALLKDTQAQIKKEPALAKHRIFLFQLLAVMGKWERALTQLNLVGEMDASALPMVHTYRQALNVEALRKAVFAGERTPLVFGKPERWNALCLEALRLDAQSKHAEAKELRSAAFEMAPATSGRFGDPHDERFDWIADADERLGPMLEAIIDGKYYWVPFARVQSLTIEPPSDLRDLVWMPAHFRWTNGGESVGLIPTRYPGSEDSSDDRIRIAARTEWVALGSEGYQGLGQRLLATEATEYALMDLRKLTFDQQPPEASAGQTSLEV
jgi:type VI secretion system protein ImpE